MSQTDLDRRDFHKLTLAAFSGALAGTLAGCNSNSAPVAKPPAGGAPAGGTPAGTAKAPAVTEVVLTEEQVTLLTDEKHACRGLNVCKGLGRSKDNDCAGQGTCASISDASCSGQNDCATLGGCGPAAGLNDCKGQGGCHVPMMDEAWDKARAAFEVAMKKSDKPVGAAPAKTAE